MRERVIPSFNGANFVASPAQFPCAFPSPLSYWSNGVQPFNRVKLSNISCQTVEYISHLVKVSVELILSVQG